MTDIVLDIAEKVIERYKNLGINEQKSYREFIANCQISDPKKLGIFKKGKTLNCYIANLNDSIRVAYDCYEDKTIDRTVIRIFNLGDHKEVYGKDK